MKLRYDLHLHSCLSPCGDMDMTPNNLVGMAKLLGYDLIALTDHNSCLNTPAAVKAGQRLGVTVVPGMELCTREEAHVVCLFPTVEAALGIYEVPSLVKAYGGTAFPAHVDKDSYSITASLGGIPPEIGFTAAELSPRADREKVLYLYPELASLRLLQDSDSHYLENMPDPGAVLELAENSPECLIALLNTPV